MKQLSLNANLQLDLFSDASSQGFEAITAALPSLPNSIRYRCSFYDKIFKIENLNSDASICASVNGVISTVSLKDLSEHFRRIVKNLFVFLLSSEKSIATAMLRIGGIRLITESDILRLITAGPIGIVNAWKDLLSKELGSSAYPAAKSLLQLCCRYRICGWSDTYLDILSTQLPLPEVDKFSAVKSGEVFLTKEEESKIVRHLDDLNTNSAKLKKSTDRELIDSAMLLCAYQFGMRPIQVAMLAIKDIRVWPGKSEQAPSVHLTFRMVKQRSNINLKPLQRKVKHEWTPIFIELYHRAKLRSESADTRIFGVASNHAAGSRIAEKISMLIGRDAATTDLRHTAAQRLVDAGASQEELAEFMGHTDITTGLVYFQTSANQAELVNRALGVSEIYQRVARIAHDRFISAEELAQLKDEQQIGGVPHGIPIAGIGGCSSGQPACPYNPVTSCYGCQKFMPLHEIGIHEQALVSLREVVLFFHNASRADQHSPAYLQLQRTIAEIQTVITEIQAGLP